MSVSFCFRLWPFEKAHGCVTFLLLLLIVFRPHGKHGHNECHERRRAKGSWYVSCCACIAPTTCDIIHVHTCRRKGACVGQTAILFGDHVPFTSNTFNLNYHPQSTMANPNGETACANFKS